MRGEIYSWLSFTDASAILHFVLPVTVREFFYLHPARCAPPLRISPLLILPSSPWLPSSRDHPERFESHFVRRETSTWLVRLFPLHAYTTIARIFAKNCAEGIESSIISVVFNFEFHMYREMYLSYHFVTSIVTINIKKERNYNICIILIV